MDLALKDIRRHLGKFIATIAGVAMLLAIVLVMNGIYQGNIADGVWLIENTATDLWVVERGRGGPFNESSRMPLDSYKSVAATPGVARASPLVLYTAQRDIRRVRWARRPGPTGRRTRDHGAALRDGDRPQARRGARRDGAAR
jgi:putative ABC transport system permease protein